MTGRLSGKRIFVTGAAQGIGLAIARRLSEDGHRVEGSTGYTVTSGASSAPAPQLTASATVTPPPPTTTSALVQPAAADDTAGSPPPWLVAVPVAILVVGAAAAATVVMRGRRTR